MTQKVLIAGGSGFTGKAISSYLSSKGYQITWVSRTVQKTDCIEVITWENLENHQNSYDIIINLCGANILSLPWTKRRKQQLLKSRIDPIDALSRFIKKSDPSSWPALWINASAVGIYDQKEQECDESSDTRSSTPGDFLKTLAHKWEHHFFSTLENSNIRLVTARFGIILDKSGGMLKPCALAFKLGLGGRLGSGTQAFPWISLEDLCGAIEKIITSPLHGPVNFTSPGNCSNLTFTKALAKALHRWALFPVPSFVLKLLLGERSTLLLQGCRPAPQKLLNAGFEFQHASIDSFLKSHLS